MTIKKCNKKWDHRASLRVSRLLKWGIFTGCASKIWIIFMRIKSWLLERHNFYLQSKASFIHISSIVSFKPFFIACLREYCTLSDSSVVNMKSSPWPKYTQYGTIFQKKNHVLLSNFFPSSNMFFIRLFLANTPKTLGGHRARVIEKEHLFRYRA